MNKAIYLGGGCFWGVQAYFDQIRGVVKTEVGYLNGGFNGVKYEQVKKHSGHVEVTKVIFDESLISINDLFAAYIRIVEPFSVNMQGIDEGIQYRIGIYAEDQKSLDEYKVPLHEWEVMNGKSEIETLIVKDYTIAEDYHQDYITKNPTGYCHINLTDIPEEFLK